MPHPLTWNMTDIYHPMQVSTMALSLFCMDYCSHVSLAVISPLSNVRAQRIETELAVSRQILSERLETSCILPGEKLILCLGQVFVLNLDRICEIKGCLPMLNQWRIRPWLPMYCISVKNCPYRTSHCLVTLCKTLIQSNLVQADF